MRSSHVNKNEIEYSQFIDKWLVKAVRLELILALISSQLASSEVLTSSSE